MKKIFAIGSLVLSAVGVITVCLVTLLPANSGNQSSEANQSLILEVSDCSLFKNETKTISYKINDSEAEISFTSLNPEIFEMRESVIVPKSAGEGSVEVMAQMGKNKVFEIANITIIKESEILLTFTPLFNNENVESFKSGTKSNGECNLYELDMLCNEKINMINILPSDNVKVNPPVVLNQRAKLNFEILSGTAFKINVEVNSKIFVYSGESTEFIKKLNIEISNDVVYLTDILDASYPNEFSYTGDLCVVNFDETFLELNNNNFSPIKTGITEVLFTANDGSGITKNFTISIKEVEATEVKIKVPESLNLNETYKLIPIILPSFASIKEVTYQTTGAISLDGNTIKAVSYGSGTLKIFLNGKEYDSIAISVLSNITINLLDDNGNKIDDTELCLDGAAGVAFITFSVEENGALVSLEDVAIDSGGLILVSVEAEGIIICYPEILEEDYQITISYKGQSLILTIGFFK